jgi:DNA-binding CsgD family transcriptional regulator
MASADKALQLIQSIYDVVLGLEDWASIIREISAATGGHSGLMRLVDCRRAEVGFVAAYGYEQSQIEDYRKHFIHLDPYCDSLAAAPTGTLLQGDQIVPLPLRQQTEYFNDYERLGDRCYALGSPLGRERDFLLYLGLSRGLRAGPYDEDTLAFVRSLLPHMLRAVQIQRLIGGAVDAQHLSEAALDRLRIGVVLMDSTLAVRFANAAALDFARTFGLSLAESGLTLPSPRFNDRLQRLLNGALSVDLPNNREAGGDLTYTRPGIGALQLRVFPLLSSHEPGLIGQRVQVAIFLVRPGPPNLNAGHLAEQFGLTVAESHLAVRLAEGRTVAEAAKLAGISVATARTHLRNIFAKTATSRQSELALLLLTSLAGLANDGPAAKEN